MSDLDIDIVVLELLRRKLVKFQRSWLVLRERSITLELLWNAHIHNSRTRSAENAQLYIRERILRTTRRNRRWMKTHILGVGERSNEIAGGHPPRYSTNVPCNLT